jgi:hypothetical protein
MRHRGRSRRALPFGPRVGCYGYCFCFCADRERSPWPPVPVAVAMARCGARGEGCPPFETRLKGEAACALARLSCGSRLPPCVARRSETWRRGRLRLAPHGEGRHCCPPALVCRRSVVGLSALSHLCGCGLGCRTGTGTGTGELVPGFPDPVVSNAQCPVAPAGIARRKQN